MTFDWGFDIPMKVADLKNNDVVKGKTNVGMVTEEEKEFELFQNMYTYVLNSSGRLFRIEIQKQYLVILTK